MAYPTFTLTVSWIRLSDRLYVAWHMVAFLFSFASNLLCGVATTYIYRVLSTTLMVRLQMKQHPVTAIQVVFKAFRLGAPTDKFVLRNDAPLAVETLQVLWVNDNSLSRVSNLDYNPTIKSLYAHNNRIGTLKVRKIQSSSKAGTICPTPTPTTHRNITL